MKQRLNLKLLLMAPALLLFATPFIGFQMLLAFSVSMTSQQQQALDKLTTIIGEDLQRNPALLDDFSAIDPSNQSLYVARTGTDIVLDGKFDDWVAPQLDTRHLAADELLVINFPYDESTLTADLSLMSDTEFLYLFIDVIDDTVVYREISNLSVHRNDHIRLACIDQDGNFQRYTIATEQPGKVNARVVTTTGRSLRPETRIHGIWRATDTGYAVELKMPLALIANSLSINIADIDDLDQRDLKYLLGNAFADDESAAGHLIFPSRELGQFLDKYALADLSLTDTAGRLLASSSVSPTLPVNNGLPVSNRVFDQLPGRLAAYLPALTAQQAIETRLGISINGETVAYLTASQSQTANQQQLQYQLAWLLLVSAVIILLGIIISYLAVSVVIGRLRRLRRELENAVDTKGRVQQASTDEFSRDEIGDLSRSFSNISRRLHQYNDYLENMAGRLAHELKTPVSVVRSSLENLEANELDPDSARFVQRAHNGVQRLTTILNNMSEATRLEQSLDSEDVIPFELTSLIKGCMAGYENAYPNQAFQLSIEAKAIKVTGIPDLFAQLMDKLINNAVEFSPAHEPIKVRLTEEDDTAVVRIANAGPNLPESMQGQIFEPMISVRAEAKREDAHLGLGLYVAKIITEFHGGDIQASNREDSQGVIITIRLPLLRLTSKL